MTQEQLQELQAKVGSEAARKIREELDNFSEKYKGTISEATKGLISKETFEEYQNAQKTAIEHIEDIAKKQGADINSLIETLGGSVTAKGKSLMRVLKEHESEFDRVYKQGSGSVSFMVNFGNDGDIYARPLSKAAGPHQTVGGTSPDFDASVTGSLSDALAIRSAADSQIVSQFRNTPFVFDLCNVTQASFSPGQGYATWFEEVVREGSSAIVPEGGAKPLVQYGYELKSSAYKKRAQLLSFSDEFVMDFPRIYSDIREKGRADLINDISSDILTNIKAAATPFSATGTPFDGTVPFANDFDAIAAMAAMVDNAAYGNVANAALMSTWKKYFMGVGKNENGTYLNRPDVLNNISFIGNPAMLNDEVIVGDLKRYNIILRGGFIVKVGYNGNDFAENKFSVVMEQFYYDWIADIHKAAIVKGPNFADVKTAIELTP